MPDTCTGCLTLNHDLIPIRHFLFRFDIANIKHVFFQAYSTRYSRVRTRALFQQWTPRIQCYNAFLFEKVRGKGPSLTRPAFLHSTVH